MTTREIFFKELLKCDLPKGFVGYFMLNDNKIKFCTIPLDFHKEEHENSINEMLKIEKNENFDCWCSSQKGERYLNEMKDIITANIGKMIR
jgi:hypothetical protein